MLQARNLPSARINIVVGGRFHASQTYHALSHLGHDVKIYSSSPARYFKNIPREKIEFFPKPSQIAQKLLRRRMPRVAHELSAIAFAAFVSMRMRHADILWGFNGDSLLCGQATQERGGRYIVDRACPHFLTQQELLTAESAKVGYPYTQFSRRLADRFLREYDIADAIVVPSRYSLNSFVEKGVDRKKLHVIPLDANAPGPQDFTKSEPVGSRAPGTEFRIGIVGGSFLRKGIIYLLRAVKILRAANVRLSIRATKTNVTQHEEANRLCRELGVEFVPYLEDINEFYQSQHVFVLPSIDEGFGMVLYEALANGTPVVASSNVGAIDKLEAGKDLLVVPPGNEHALADSLCKLYENDDYRCALGQAGRDFYISKMSAGSEYGPRVKQLVDDLHSGKRQ